MQSTQHTGSCSQLVRDFIAICDCGGRLAGTGGEREAISLLERLGREATGVATEAIVVPYAGWKAKASHLWLDNATEVPCQPLVRSVPTPAPYLEAEVIDLCRGTPEEFAAHADETKGRIALVRHELMFAAGTIHRRLKYNAALKAGAVGFLISGPLSGHLVAGSCGRTGSEGIPAAGISPDTASKLSPSSSGYRKIRLSIETSEHPATTKTLVFDMPGQTDRWVVLSAHIDGHSLAESAIDNASGVAVSLDVARCLAPGMPHMRRGLRLIFFSIEEWALLGSAAYVEALSPEQRGAIALNVNLDSVAGGSRLTALTSGFANLEPFILGTAESAHLELRIFRPLQMNSDHANFARVGIPALRLVAGFDDPSASTRFVLTSADTRDKVQGGELLRAAKLATEITRAALNAPPEVVANWRHDRR